MKNNADISGHLGSNGTITITNNLDVCGNVTPGPGKDGDPSGRTSPSARLQHDACRGAVRPPARRHREGNPQRQRAAHEHEGRLRYSAGHLLHLQQDHLEQLDQGAHDRQRDVEPDRQRLPVLRFDLKSGGKVQIASRSTPLFIYIDSPENCGGRPAWAPCAGRHIHEPVFPRPRDRDHGRGKRDEGTNVDLPRTTQTARSGSTPPTRPSSAEQRDLHGRGRRRRRWT